MVLLTVVVAVLPATAAQMQTPSDVAVKTAPLIDRLIDALVRDKSHQTACQVVCVSGSGSWCSDVGVDAVGVDEGELLEGLFPVRGDLAFDEAAGCLALGGWVALVLWRVRRARLSSMSQIASQSSLTAATSLGKWPRFLVTLRSW